jgi:hypothetical protein
LPIKNHFAVFLTLFSNRTISGFCGNSTAPDLSSMIHSKPGTVPALIRAAALKSGFSHSAFRDNWRMLENTKTPKK